MAIEMVRFTSLGVAVELCAEGLQEGGEDLKGSLKKETIVLLRLLRTARLGEGLLTRI